MSEFFDFIPEYTTKIYKFGSHEPADAISVLNPRLQMLCNNIAYLLQLVKQFDNENQKNTAKIETEINQNLNALQKEFNQISNDTTQILQKHKNNYNNPHIVTKEQIGLGNVNNTSDENKPISLSMQTALNGKANISHTHTAAQVGAVPTSRKVNGKNLNSDIMLSASDIGLGNVNNISDVNKPISIATQNALNEKANAFHTHIKNEITDFPVSLPASDVHPWAKSSQKPSYTWYEIKDKPNYFTPASHTHNYSSITSGTGTDYTSYRVRDIALLPYTPSYLGNGQIALVYT